MTNRLQCCVPFCRRTIKREGRPDFAEWICGKHWRLLPQKRRKVYGRVMKAWRRYRSADGVARADRLWFRLKRQAIEAAGGIG
jgi:hypothetical protein